MASKNRKEEKAEGAARYAADEIKSAREERESDQQQQMHKDYYSPLASGAATNTNATTTTTTTGQNRPGIISSVVGAIGSTYEHAKEAVTGKTHDAAEGVSRSMKVSHDDAAVRARQNAELAREGKENTAERLKETKDYTADKTKDAAGYVGDKTRDAAGYVGDKTREAVDKTKDAAGYLGEKTKETKDYTVDKTKDAAGYLGDKTREAVDKTKETAGYLGDKTKETKDSAADAAKRTKEKIGETAETVKDKTWEAKEEAKDTAYKGTREAEEARRRMDEEKRVDYLKEKGYNTVVDEDAQRAQAERDAAALRGETGKSTSIFGAIGNMAEAVKSKLTIPSNDEEARGKSSNFQGREVKVTIEESPAGAAEDIRKDTKKMSGSRPGVGAVADLLKNADQITGQSFSPNDVGSMDEDTTTTTTRR